MLGNAPLQNAALSVNIKMTPVTLVAGAAAVRVVVANPNRKILAIQNTGTGPLSFGTGSTLAAGQGLSLDQADVAGGEGGSYEFKDFIPQDEIWMVSATGTTAVVMEGW